MDRITLHSRVGSDGVLAVAIPLGMASAGREVTITVEPVASPLLEMSREEWQRQIDTTAGSIVDPTFWRHEQGEYEQRKDWP